MRVRNCARIIILIIETTLVVEDLRRSFTVAIYTEDVLTHLTAVHVAALVRSLTNYGGRKPTLRPPQYCVRRCLLFRHVCCRRRLVAALTPMKSVING